MKLNAVRMSKFTAGCLALCTLFAFFLAGCEVGKNEQHTGAATFTGSGEMSDTWQFESAGGDLFVMRANEATKPRLYVGEKFLDVVYQKSSVPYAVDFLHAKKDPSSPPPPKPEETTAMMCNDEGCHPVRVRQ